MATIQNHTKNSSSSVLKRQRSIGEKACFRFMQPLKGDESKLGAKWATPGEEGPAKAGGPAGSQPQRRRAFSRVAIKLASFTSGMQRKKGKVEHKCGQEDSPSNNHFKASDVIETAS